MLQRYAFSASKMVVIYAYLRLFARGQGFNRQTTRGRYPSDAVDEWRHAWLMVWEWTCGHGRALLWVRKTGEA
jgi:hypothetical protein